MAKNWTGCQILWYGTGDFFGYHSCRFGQGAWRRPAGAGKIEELEIAAAQGLMADR